MYHRESRKKENKEVGWSNGKKIRKKTVQQIIKTKISGKNDDEEKETQLSGSGACV